MTDYFALLDQPRRPWLEPEQVKQAFHARALQVHPDAQLQQEARPSSDALFAQLNEAYQVLQDPKRRLQHLLRLEGYPPDRTPGATPPQIEQLFPMVAAATQRAAMVAQQSAAATNLLARTLLKSEMQNAANELELVREKVRQIQETAIARLQQLDRCWTGKIGDGLDQFRSLYLEFSYVTRWLAEVQEKQLQLSTR